MNDRRRRFWPSPQLLGFSPGFSLCRYAAPPFSSQRQGRERLPGIHVPVKFLALGILPASSSQQRNCCVAPFICFPGAPSAIKWMHQSSIQSWSHDLSIWHKACVAAAAGDPPTRGRCGGDRLATTSKSPLTARGESPPSLEIC